MNNEITVVTNSSARKWLITLGIILILGGLFCAVLPKFVGIALELIVGGALIISGILSILAGVATGRDNRWAFIIPGAVEIILGVFILRHPLFGLMAVTAYIGIALIVASIGRFLTIHHLSDIRHNLFSFLGAVVGLGIGGYILFGNLENVSDWLLGTIIGVNFLIVGSALVIAGKSQKV